MVKIIGVIVAAGMGTRLGLDIPKCLVKIDGKRLIEMSLDALNQYGIKETIIITGFRGHLIKQAIGKKYKDMKITYYTNKKYEKTGSMYSLHQIKRRVNDDIILLESDLLYDPKLIKIALNSEKKDLMLVSEATGSGDEAFVFIKNNEIVNISKDLKGFTEEMVGISKLSKSFLSKVFEIAEMHFKVDNFLKHYEEVFVEARMYDHPISAVKCDLVWTEIDTPEHLRKAKEEVYPKCKNK